MIDIIDLFSFVCYSIPCLKETYGDYLVCDNSSATGKYLSLNTMKYCLDVFYESFVDVNVSFECCRCLTMVEENTILKSVYIRQETKAWCLTKIEIKNTTITNSLFFLSFMHFRVILILRQILCFDRSLNYSNITMRLIFLTKSYTADRENTTGHHHCIQCQIS